MRSGIYSITHIATSRHYVGSSRDVRARMKSHKHLLRAGKHHSLHLQRAWIKYGEDAFAFCVLEVVECADDLLQMEQVWIDRLHAAEPTRGFNTATVAGTRAGVPHSEEVRKKMSEARKGRQKSADHRAKIGAANRGKKRTDETRRLIASAVSMQMQEPARRAKAAEYGKLSSGTKGKTMSESTRANMSLAAKKRVNGKERGDDGRFIQ